MSKKRQTHTLRKPNRYSAIIGTIFKNHFKQGQTQFEFSRDEFVEIARLLNIALPKNLGDTIYSFRFRTALPPEIVATAGKGREWLIELAGRSIYRFRLAKIANIVANTNMMVIKIPDATPEIIAGYALSDEQALLAKVRYNRLVDTFLGLTTYSLQSHMRTTVKAMGDAQIEIDEVYVGVNKHGEQFVIPVQAKGGDDRLSAVQTSQDIACCREKFAGLTCRSLSAQFMLDSTIALFELALEGEDVKIVDEKHYKLVPSDQISAEDFKLYSKS